MIRALAGLLLLVVLGGAAPGPRLITDLSQSRIDIEYTFAGADLLMFGAIDRTTMRPDRKLDLVVVVRSPAQPVVVRQKERVAGVWLNTRSVRFQTVPGYYSVATTRPIGDLVDPRMAAIYEFGIDNLHFSPAETERSAEELRTFQAGLIDLRRRGGLFTETIGGVRVVEGVLFRARARLPGDVPVGEYRVYVFLVEKGRVIAQTSVPLTVGKSGFERAVYTFAQENSVSYGLLAVAIALAAGWVAGAIMRK